MLENALMEKYPSVTDMQRLAMKRLPLLAREYLEAGTGEDLAVSKNRTAFQNIELIPYIIKGSLNIHLETALLDKKWALPFGIAPIGLTGLMWPGAEQALARMARAYNIPFCLSTVATQTPEDIGKLCGNGGWFQLYPPRSMDICGDIIKRARDSGFDTLLVTADVPVPSRRERIRRAGLSMPPRTTARMIWDALTHPAWLKATLLHGSPRLRTIEKYTRDKSRAAVARYVEENLGGTLDWKYLSQIRKLWKGPILIKGILHPEDARKVHAEGFDGIIVSNHGGRQFDASPAAIEVLPAIARAIQGKLPVVFDSGIRSGLDILKATSLGADFVLVGRAFLYGLAALGDPGAAHVADILTDELKNNMLQLGIARLKSSVRFHSRLK